MIAFISLFFTLAGLFSGRIGWTSFRHRRLPSGIRSKGNTKIARWIGRNLLMLALVQLVSAALMFWLTPYWVILISLGLQSACIIVLALGTPARLLTND